MRNCGRRRAMTNKSMENRDEIVLSRILKLIGINNFDMNDFDNRLKYQKLIYLAQATGINIGYGYSWYIRGPYSPFLTKTLFNIQENPTLFEKWNTIKFKQEDDICKRITRLAGILGDKFHNPEYLEILASLHYLHTTLPASENSCTQLKSRLLVIKPNLKKVPDINMMIDKACKDLKQLN